MACEARIVRRQQSDSAITQNVALSLQNDWFPAGNAQRGLSLGKRRQLDYGSASPGKKSLAHEA
jgi:hypothetical protein